MRTRTPLCLAVLVALLVLGSSAASASAAVRTASVSLPAPYQPPSLSAQTPVVDTEPYLHTATISYDDVAGSVTGSMSLYDPSYWASQDSTGGRFRQLEFGHDPRDRLHHCQRDAHGFE